MPTWRVWYWSATRRKIGGKMMRVVAPSRDELEEKRRAILARLGLTYEAFRDRAEAGSLVGEEWEAWEELQDVAFLLGES